MQETMPQEIEVRYILPAIRRELARIFIQDHKLNQKEAAKILGYDNFKPMAQSSIIKVIETGITRVNRIGDASTDT